jgi:S-DNA-T family DNA segregation ATPase FtsK/SpoIIIE
MKNQFKPKSDQNKDSASPSKSSKKKLHFKPYKRLKERFDAFIANERTQKITGLSLLLISVYLLIAFTSFIFTGRADFSEIYKKSVVDFLFDSSIHAENWLGNLGAAVAHLFMYSWFGMASFAFVMLFFLAGFKVLFKVDLLPPKKTFRYTTFFLIWTSIALGYLFYNSDFKALYGAFGFQVNTWLFRVIGKAGAGLLIFFVLLVFLVYAFNISLHAFRLKEAEKENEEGEQAAEEESDVITQETTSDEAGLTTEPTSTEEEEISDEEVAKENEMPLEITPAAETEVNVESDEEDQEVEEPIEAAAEEENKEKEEEEDLSFAVEDTTQKADNLSDKEVNKALEDFGEYDPTLDLPHYKIPGVDLLKDYGDSQTSVTKQELEENKNRIVQTLENYNIKIQNIKATIGPTVTLYEIVPAAGVRISRIKNLEDDIALSLSALGIRIIAPMPGKGTIGIEVPNQQPEMVSMRSVITSEKFKNAKMELPVVMGKTISNETFVFDLAKLPHLLMAGATGQGKSVGLNAILTSLLYRKHPAQLKLVLVDPKKVELTLFNKIERHFLAKLPDTEDAIITDNKKVITTLNSLCVEMDQRYELLKSAYVRNITEYNKKFIARKLNPEKGHKYLPYIVLVVDEFADLIMTAGREVEQPIARLAQLARAIGIHLIIATQRPSANIITGSIKANFPARIAFRVTSGIDSRTILDSGGADQLIGRGDMLLSTGSDLIRLQCAFVDTPEVERLTEFIGSQRAYPSAFELPEYADESGSGSEGTLAADDRDDLFEDAARIIVQHQQGSASLLQRRLKLGYNRAGRIIDQLEAAGIIGPFEGSKARQVLIKDELSLEQFLNNDANPDA